VVAPPAQPPAVVTPAPAAPSTARLSIVAAPPEARVLLDGAPLGNPFLGSFVRGPARHHLEVRAAGRRTESRWIVLDRDLALEIRLLPVTAPPARAAASTAPAAAATERSASRPAARGRLITDFPENETPR
jgi:hypothetical protein